MNFQRMPGVRSLALLTPLLLGLWAPPVHAADPAPESNPDTIARALAESWPERPEWLDMFADILQGSQLGPNDGWFRRAVAQTRFTWDATRAGYDGDGDGQIARAEFPGSDADFARLDRNGNRSLDAADFDFSPHALAPSPGMMLFYQADRDGNGKITPEEFQGIFRALDSGAQGFLSLSDLQAALPMPSAAPPSAKSGKRPGGPSKETLIRGLFQQEIGSLQPGPALGEPAPDFTLKTNDGGRDVQLSRVIGGKPVVLVFGNFTCGPFRSRAGDVEKLYRMYSDRAEFVMVYVREAHPTDGWSMESNARVGVALAQPRTYEERVAVAQTCGKSLGLRFPMVVDAITDEVGARYSGMPSRLYLIDQNGKIAYKSGRGPFGFKPAELEQSLLLLLQEQAQAKRDAASAKDSVPDSAEAWRFLPPAERGAGAPLPFWARALARSLPRTTAAMLDLDQLHRTHSPLGPELRGKMRWVAAHANRSPYALAYAEADLRRAGVGDAAIHRLKEEDLSDLPEPERAALAFARTMTLQADAVNDDEVAYLKSVYGEEKLTAMVLLLAYANFQDRLLLSLDAQVEPGGPLPPPDVQFARNAPAPEVPARVSPDGSNLPTVPSGPADPEWVDIDFDQLQRGLDTQRERPGRIRVPTFEEVVKRLPPGYPRPKNPIRIQWSLVCMGYQPELTAAWFACTRAFGEEARQDRVFEESLFWVVTRTIHCFY